MKIQSSKYVSPQVALQNLNPHHLIHKLQKLKIIPASSLNMQEKLQEYLKGCTPKLNLNKLKKYLDKLKVSDDGKQKIALYHFINEGQLLTIVPELNRLTHAEKQTIIQLKNAKK